MIRYILTYLIFLVIPLAVKGQEELYNFKYLTTKDGLSNNSVRCILQDREGFMWFGTGDGLNKYDGHTFTVFKPDPVNPENTLRGSEVWDIHEDRVGRLWVATYEGGLQQVDKRTGRITSHSMDSLKASRWDELFTISEDNRGNLWLGTEKGLVRYNPDTKQVKKFPAPRLIHTEAMAMLQEDPFGNYWAFNIDAVFQFNTYTGKYTVYPIVINPPVKTPLIWGIKIDKAGMIWVVTDGAGLLQMDVRDPGKFIIYKPGLINTTISPLGIYENNQDLWLATSQGLQCVNKETDRISTHNSDPSTPGSLTSNDVRSVYVDKTGTLWVGTSNGINLSTATRKPFIVRKIVPSPGPFYNPTNLISSILEDPSGSIWVGSAGKQIIQYTASNGRGKSINAVQVVREIKGEVKSLLRDRKGQMWVSTGSEKELRLLDRATGRFISFPCKIPVEELDEDPTGRIWIGGWTFGVASFDPQTHKFIYYKPSVDSSGLLPASVQDVLASKTGEIWVATYAGISRLNPATGKFRNYVQRTGQLNDYKVMILHEDREGIIWAGTNQGGLTRLDPETHTFTYFTTKDGLPSNQIRSILEDEEGLIWIGTNRGLSRFNPKTKSFRNYDILDGLPDNEFIYGSAYNSRGLLMFGTRNGYVLFEPGSIKDNSVPPPVYITHLKVMGKDRPLLASTIELAHQENVLSFDFVALNYDSPEKNQYAYQLLGQDKEWVLSNTRRYASYTNLEPGEYTFRVKASTDDGVWNDQVVAVHIVIHPPWWKTWWAYGIYCILVAGALYSLRQYTINRERLKNDLRMERLEARKMHELDQIKSRFFANISHEFRTPLTLILSPLENLIRQEPADSKNRLVFQLMHRNAKQLLKLINQLLELARLEAGRLQLDTKAGAIVPFLKGSILGFTSLAERNQIYYSAIFPDMEPVVLFDSDKLGKIVTNLISNALKFTNRGGVVHVRVSLSDMASDTHDKRLLLEIKVSDTGIGIPQEEINKIFDRFYQVDHAHSLVREGTGIGLALTRELVEIHGGTIGVESTLGLGSTFCVKVPLLLVELPQTGTEKHLERTETVEEQSPGLDEEATLLPAKPKYPVKHKAPVVLLVDDNADVRYFIRDTICNKFNVLEATNGVEALDMATEQIPDLIISDVMMPHLDGVSLCRRLKTDLRTNHIPIILLTAKAGEESKIAGLETGADDYLTKPFHAEELMVRVYNHIKRRGVLKDYFSKRITVEPQSVIAPSMDEQFIRKALTIIEEHIANPEFDVEMFGREMGMSRIHLHRKLKSLTDQSPSDFIRIIRLKKAASQLEQNSGNISEIAFSVGFSSLTYFTRCFRQVYGVKPSEYVQRQIKGKGLKQSES